MYVETIKWVISYLWCPDHLAEVLTTETKKTLQEPTPTTSVALWASARPRRKVRV